MKILFLVLLIFFIGAIWSWKDHKRMKRIALERGEPDVCAFARSFDYRDVDTKIIREVWEELKKYLGKFDGQNFPIKADDLFNETYKLDPEDLDELYQNVAERLGISTEEPEKNPYWEKVTTVKELVLFLHHQPREKNA